MKEVSNFKSPTLFYDSECKFCTKTKSIVNRFDSKDVKFHPLTTKAINQFRKEMYISKDVSENVMYYKNRSGTLSFGSKAFFEYLKDKKGMIHLLGLLGDFPLIRWFSEKLYLCIALNRYTISKLL